MQMTDACFHMRRKDEVSSGVNDNAEKGELILEKDFQNFIADLYRVRLELELE